MISRLTNYLFGSSFVRYLRPWRQKLRQSLPLFNRFDAWMIRLVASRIESGFQERLIDTGRVGEGHLRLINWRLWSGHSVRALEVLGLIVATDRCSATIRAEAALYSAVWYAANGSPEKSIQRQEQALALAPRIEQSDTFALLWMDNLLDLGRYSALEKYAAEVRERGLSNPHRSWGWLNALRAFEPDSGEAVKQWLRAANAMFSARGMGAIQQRRKTDTLSIDNLEGCYEKTSSCLGISEEPLPLVSVIMPAYNAADRIGVALQSLLEQRWSNLEVLVVDDCSSDQTAEVVARYSARDDRVKYFRMPRNMGSYSARNLGLEHARGDFVTTHDIDDWSHPDKLAAQVKELLACPASIGNMSMAIRCTENLRLLGNWRPNGLLLKENMSSFMFRRSIIERVSGWDSVRIGGDSEFVNRVKRVFGPQSVRVVLPELPLSFVLGDHESLTSAGATHIRSFYFGVRREYAAMAGYWRHRLSRESSEMKVDINAKSKHMVPEMIRPDRNRQVRVNLVAVLDAANDSDAVDYVMDCRRTMGDDLAIGIFHWPDFGAPRENDIQINLRRLAFEGKLTVLLPGQVVTADRLVLASNSNLRSFPDSHPEVLIPGSNAISLRKGSIESPEVRRWINDFVVIGENHPMSTIKGDA